MKRGYVFRGNGLVGQVHFDEETQTIVDMPSEPYVDIQAGDAINFEEDLEDLVR
jgi:hypothetical protein